MYKSNNRLQNSRVFFSKSVKKSVKSGVKVVRARSARASHALHALRACEAREEKRIFSVSPQSRSLFSVSFQTFSLTARAYLKTQKIGLFSSLVEQIKKYLYKKNRAISIYKLSRAEHKKLAHF